MNKETVEEVLEHCNEKCVQVIQDGTSIMYGRLHRDMYSAVYIVNSILELGAPAHPLYFEWHQVIGINYRGCVAIDGEDSTIIKITIKL